MRFGEWDQASLRRSGGNAEARDGRAGAGQEDGASLRGKLCFLCKIGPSRGVRCSENSHRFAGERTPLPRHRSQGAPHAADGRGLRRPRGSVPSLGSRISRARAGLGQGRSPRHRLGYALPDGTEPRTCCTNGASRVASREYESSSTRYRHRFGSCCSGSRLRPGLPLGEHHSGEGCSARAGQGGATKREGGWQRTVGAGSVGGLSSGAVSGRP